MLLNTARVVPWIVLFSFESSGRVNTTSPSRCSKGNVLVEMYNLIPPLGPFTVTVLSF